MLLGGFFVSLPDPRVYRRGLASLEMSAVKALNSSMSAQATPDLSTESSTLCSVLPNTPRPQKRRKKSKKHLTTSQKIQQGLKRKWNEVLEPGSSDSVLENTHKMSRPLETNELEHGGSLSDTYDVDSGFSSETSPPTSGRCSPCVGVHPSMMLAIDCEMVGTGPNGRFSELARCSVLNYSGTVIYDKYILPCRPVTDYRTQWSGIKKEHLINALPYELARKEILQIINGKIIIGHALHHDFASLRMKLPRHMVRDTSFSHLLRKLYGPSTRCISLKKLTSALLNRSIQVDSTGHCSAEDARAALDLYKLVEEEWEKSLQPHGQILDPVNDSSPSLEHYMRDEYWPDGFNNCNE